MLRGVETESVVTALLVAMADASRALLGKANALRGEPGWSSVTHELEAGRSFVDPAGVDTMVMVDLYGLRPGPWIEGYVDGNLDGVGNVAWTFAANREATAWRVSRSVEIDGETATELPEAVLETTAELAGSMLVLVEELLRVPARA
jgi:hypothetical protein